jgi:hypothetical protein
MNSSGFTYAFIIPSYKVFWTMKNQRRIGEFITICCGIGLAIVGLVVSVPPVTYGGLCIMGLGVVSVFWR